MLSTGLLIILTVNSVHTQLNGEFWWLNNKLNGYRNTQPSSTQFEELSDTDTDETAKVVFRDNDLYTNKLTKPTSSHKNEKQRAFDYSSGKIVWPNEADINGHNDDNDQIKGNKKVVKPKEEKKDSKDEFVFNFTENEKYSVVENSTQTVPQLTTEKTENYLIGEILFNDESLSSGLHKDKEAQSICTHIKAKQCYKNKGIIYKDWDQKEPGDQDIICCILPIQSLLKTNDRSSIYFPGAVNKKPRSKRSDDGSLQQRNFLLLQKYPSQHQKIPPAPTPSSRIVTPEEEYVDPYWNIKNSKFHIQNHKVQTQKYDYDDYGDDYVDYASELPRPGLVGLYSDHAKSPSSWSFTSNSGVYGAHNSDDYEEDDVEEDTFGYSTIDPRKVAENKKHKTKPMRLTTISDEVTVDAESHTINFQSNPDFQVLQGFKLLNLFRNRSRFHTKDSRTTTERVDDSKEFLGTRPDESSEVGDEFFEEDQLFGGCGDAVSIKAKDKDKQLGEAPNGSHPWMVLVVLSKRRQNVLCYGTLIHPRAAITVADCVHGTSPRDITVIAGAWDLNEKSRLKNRVASIQVHPKYKSGDNENNLAVLYWMRPLKLGTNIQPACLGEPHVGDDCRFFGWGSLDQGIQLRSKWQRASIRVCDARGNRRPKTSEAFCATASRGSVTGLGGSLICDIDGRYSVVGAVVAKDQSYTLMPVREFAMKASELISGD